jgi:cyclopropane fatty-acyl-phospholipid synthase-like methyltransferase
MQRIFRAIGRRLGVARSGGGFRPAGDVFDTWAQDGRDDGMERAHGPVVRRILDDLTLDADTRYLDIGCGNGYSVRWAAERGAGTAVGLDVSKEMIGRARALSSGLPHVTFEHSSFPEHTLTPASFDVILSMEAMYYMTDLDAALREVLALLKPGGLFVCAVDFFREHRRSHKWPRLVGTEMKLMSARGWRRAFEHAGFRSVRQARMIIPQDEAGAASHASVGCLVTFGTGG